MSKSYRLAVSMQAFGKARPRCHGKRPPYLPADYKEKIKLLQAAAREQENENNAIPDGVLAVTILVTRAIPKSTSKKRQAEMMGTFCGIGPDVDNIAGAIMDALLPHSSGGDSRVASLSVSKVWGETDNIIVSLQSV